mmetsp:Transcript_6094/g.10978  ORF Transcript_6094/g.10978 Transcript_6094/m.10978 type:complete len:121 (-) Transcript_6094:124-486(-)|eukprot:CAMPEP_0184706448 /NCGR_PEP_ID=MMETSP0313-20130426/36761_1 /TAXON_ID=2792 /ORGANISM="Porphyridium aerugineum, Strain SAG 1380-2" /LENGTH=120 /DNA_ID=CAMNT_0027168001 /DNA_START=1098 /DNA_END=1460 /DNA_ORIENTATION=+
MANIAPHSVASDMSEMDSQSSLPSLRRIPRNPRTEETLSETDTLDNQSTTGSSVSSLVLRRLPSNHSVTLSESQRHRNIERGFSASVAAPKPSGSNGGGTLRRTYALHGEDFKSIARKLK